jgi:hypothetical protein
MRLLLVGLECQTHADSNPGGSQKAISLFVLEGETRLERPPSKQLPTKRCPYEKEDVYAYTCALSKGKYNSETTAH